ncbi:GNAT family N-acetyltransferase [Caulobacter sp. S45]|uniref:GNAT family N-acetyltransferase n=1 Tax=Caulobacter sp. S45 TaxID=1641861 RepID=UPI001576693F|nr:GNAT family N-acetyltransferase [Caulobacter sp. S45]
MSADLLEPRIETERLALRPPRLSDAVYIAELANDPEVARMTTGVRYPYRLSDAELYLSALAKGGLSQTRAFLIEHCEVGPVGMAGLYRGKTICAELGFWLGRPFRERGLATEAVCGLLGWAADDWRCRATLAGHFADNPASGRVLEKAGFLYTGEVRQRFSFGRGQDVATRMMVWLA